MLGISRFFQLLALILTVLPVVEAQARSHATQDLPDIVPAWDEGELDDPFEGEESEEADELNGWDRLLGPSSLVKWSISFGGTRPLSFHADDLMLPASTQKTITSIAVLKHLRGGRDFRFRTVFQYDYDPSTKAARNPEFLVVGDPTWGHPDYDKRISQRLVELAAELKRKGVERIVLPIQVNNMVPAVANWVRPEGTEEAGPWRPSWRFESYASVPTPFTINQNLATFKITGYNSAEWQTSGAQGALIVDLSAKSQSPFKIEPILDTHRRATGYRLTGKMPAARYFTVHLHNGEEWLKSLAASTLAREGLIVSPLAPPPRLMFSNPSDLTLGSLASWGQKPKETVEILSRPLHEMLVPFMRESLNLIGDRLYLELAHQLQVSDVSEFLKRMIFELSEKEAVAQARNDPNLKKALEAKYQARFKGVALMDGSGLRLDNRMRASVFRRLLEDVRGEPYFDDLLNALAEAGKNGTLRHRLSGPLTRGRVFGKTGTVDHVKNLVGYLRRSNGQFEPFVFLTHTRPVQSGFASPMIDRVLVEFARQNAGLALSLKPSGGVAKKAPVRTVAR